MRQTVVGVFDKYTAAQQAAHTLQTTGFADSVFISEAMAGPPSGSATLAHPGLVHADEGVVAHLRSFFVELFGTEERHTPLGVRPGGALVRVEVDQESDLDTVRQTLQSAGAVDIEERPEDPPAPRTPAAFTAASPRRPPMAMHGPAADLPVLNDPVDKRMPASGRHQATPLTGAQVGLGPQAKATAQDIAFRQDFDRRHADTVDRYDEFQPAYCYGQELRADPRHAGQTWDELAPHARIGWERRYPTRAWDRFKLAIRHGWELAIHA